MQHHPDNVLQIIFHIFSPKNLYFWSGVCCLASGLVLMANNLTWNQDVYVSFWFRSRTKTYLYCFHDKSWYRHLIRQCLHPLSNSFDTQKELFYRCWNRLNTCLVTCSEGAITTSNGCCLPLNFTDHYSFSLLTFSTHHLQSGFGKISISNFSPLFIFKVKLSKGEICVANVIRPCEWCKTG